MRIKVNNVITITDPNQAIIEYCLSKLILDNPEYLVAKKLGKYCRNISKTISLYYENDNQIVVPYGCFQDIYKIVKDKSLFKSDISPFKANKMQGNIKLLDYQINAVNVLKSAKYGVLESPCGSGKTIMGLQLIKEIGAKALWLTHTSKLLNQSLERVQQFFQGEFGTITDGKINIGKDITFATVQTMSQIDPEIYKNEFSIVIVDECHHAFGSPTRMSQFYKIINNCNCLYKFGLSATLTRQDGLIRSVYALLGPKRYTIDQKEVSSNVMKAEYIQVPIDYELDYRTYINEDGTINYTKLVNMLCKNKERNNYILNLVKKLSKERKKILILCYRVEQCKYLAEKYGQCNCVHGNAKNKNMDQQVIFATFQLAKEGLDLPELDTLILTAPIKDEIAVKQSVGRVERKYPNKMQPVVYDLVDQQVPYCVHAAKKRKRILKKN